MRKDSWTLEGYLDALFAGLEKALCKEKERTFTFSHTLEPSSQSGANGVGVGKGYSRWSEIVDVDQRRLTLTLRCCEDEKKSNPAHLFFGSYVIDAVSDAVDSTLHERGAYHLLYEASPLFNGVSIEDAVMQIRWNAELHLEKDLYDSYGLSCEVMDYLSLEPYEQEGARGNLVFLSSDPEEGPKGPYVWKKRETGDRILCTQEQLRTLRKLLAGTAPARAGDDGAALVFVKEEGVKKVPVFRGAVPLSDGLPPAVIRSGCAQVRIDGHLKWGLFLYGKLVCSRKNDGICFPTGLDSASIEEAARHQIQDALRSAFTGESSQLVSEQLDRLTEMIEAVGRQRHGAAVVVADWTQGACQAMLERLVKDQKAMPVTFSLSNPVTSEESAAITSAAKMDGAILVDICKGEIIALAAILDGISCVKGDSSRGARYNSIANATAWLHSPETQSPETQSEAVSFVFSSDGGMDIISPCVGSGCGAEIEHRVTTHRTI